MSLVKQSQSLLEGMDIPAGDTNDLKMSEPTDEELNDLVVMDSEHDHGHSDPLLQVMDQSDPSDDIILVLDKVPGGHDQDDIVEPELEVEEPEEVIVDDDPWSALSSMLSSKKMGGYLAWLSRMMQRAPEGSPWGIPSHSGRDSAGIERAIAYLEELNKSISKAARFDFKNEIAIEALEKARDEIQTGIDRLEDRLSQIISSKYPKNKKKKKADEDSDEMVKTAGSPRINGITVTVDLLISSLARSCINGMVSAGHDIERTFVALAKEYELNSREKLCLAQLLDDMGYTVRRDLGMPLDKEIDTTSVDNVNFMANYYA